MAYVGEEEDEMEGWRFKDLIKTTRSSREREREGGGGRDRNKICFASNKNKNKTKLFVENFATPGLRF